MKKQKIMSNISFIYNQIYKCNYKVILYYISSILVNGLLPVCFVIFPKIIIDDVVNGDLEHINYLPFVSLAVSVIILYGLKGYLDSLSDANNTLVRFHFLSLYYKKCMQLEYRYTEDVTIINNVEKMLCLGNGMDRGILGTVMKLIEVLQNCLTVLIYSYILLKVNFLIIIFIILFSFISSVIEDKAKKYEINKDNERIFKERKVNCLFRSMYDADYGKEVRIYKMQTLLTKKFRDASAEYINLVKKIRHKYLLAKDINNLFDVIKQGGVILVLIYLTIQGRVSLGELSMYILIVNQFSEYSNRIFNNIRWIICENALVSEVFDFLNIEEKKDKFEKFPDKLERVEIELRDLSFKYPNSNNFILMNINLKIKGGEKIAIVGKNGEGKSTLIKLICGLYKPTSGKILLNNVNIENYNIHDYLKFISAVFQDSRLWAFTLAENITCMKNNDYDKNLLNLSIEKSDLSDKVNNLEKGIHTNIDRHLELDGIQLSGGESQKVMLARALYKEGKLMVFDEPTAALDPIAEYNTYLNFDKIIGENTALYISHRLSSTRFCDKIILLNDKKIEAVGTHKELLETNKLYREMFTIQGQYYNDQREGDLG